MSVGDSFYPKTGLSILPLTSVAYRLHFVDVVVVNDVVKRGVELVEEVHNLVRSAGARELSEAHDVAGPEEQPGFSQLLKVET